MTDRSTTVPTLRAEVTSPQRYLGINILYPFESDKLSVYMLGCR